jgi:hypothetical protein
MRNFRILFVLILLALVPVSGVRAATVKSSYMAAQERPRATTLAVRFKSLQQLWAGFWSKEGCGADPWGRCGASSTSQTQRSDLACGADPLGRCLPDH